jgi:hypothetical protein
MDNERRFEFRMVRDLGWQSVERMRAGMIQAEFVEWIAFYRLEAADQLQQAKRRRASGG